MDKRINIEADHKAEFTEYVLWCGVNKVIPAAYSEFKLCADYFAARLPTTGETELPPLPMTKAQYGLDHTLSFCAHDMRQFGRDAIAHCLKGTNQ